MSLPENDPVTLQQLVYKARDLRILVDRQIWQLLDFRKPVAEEGSPP